MTESSTHSNCTSLNFVSFYDQQSVREVERAYSLYTTFQQNVLNAMGSGFQSEFSPIPMTGTFSIWKLEAIKSSFMYLQYTIQWKLACFSIIEWAHKYCAIATTTSTISTKKVDKQGRLIIEEDDMLNHIRSWNTAKLASQNHAKKALLAIKLNRPALNNSIGCVGGHELHLGTVEIKRAHYKKTQGSVLACIWLASVLPDNVALLILWCFAVALCIATVA